MATGNLGQLLPALFVGKNGERLTEDQMRQRQAIASSLLKQATDTSPNAGGWASILAKGVQGFAAGRQNNQIDAALQASADATRAADNSFWSGLTGGTASTVPMPTAAGEVAATSPAIPTTPTVNISGSREDFVNSLLPAAIQESQRTGVDPRIIVAQAAQETGWGKSAPGNNYFGIKSHGQSGGNSLMTTEYVDGSPVQVRDSFRGYNSPADSVRGYGDFILQNPRYKPLREAQGLDAQLAALGASGYATDPNYANSVGAIARGIALPATNAIPPVMPVETAALDAPQTATDAINTVSPTGYRDPMVTTAYRQPETVSAPTMAPAQDISPVAQALVSQPTEAVKGGRVGTPFDQGRFASPEASPVFDINAAMQPQEAAPQASPVAQTLASQAPQQAQFSIPQPQYRTAPPLNPGVIAALRNPDTSPETRRVAAALYQQNLAQQQAVQEENLKLQQGQQAIQQRVQVAQQLGINPANALDDETWKQAVQAASGGAKFINAGDGNIYNSQTGEWMQAPNASNKFRQATPEEAKAFGTNGQVGPDGRFYPVTPPQGTSLSVDPNTGAISFNQGAGVKPLTEGQSKDTFFQTRMSSALPTLEANESALLNLGGKLADAVPMNLGNYAQSEDYQLARDAGRDFVTAYLRKDSGAAITPQEEKVYGELLLPQPGDNASTIEAKRTRRRVAVEAIKSGMPQQALDNAVRAIKASGGDKAITPKKIGGYTVEEVTD